MYKYVHTYMYIYIYISKDLCIAHTKKQFSTRSASCAYNMCHHIHTNTYVNMYVYMYAKTPLRSLHQHAIHSLWV